MPPSRKGPFAQSKSTGDKFDRDIAPSIVYDGLRMDLATLLREVSKVQAKYGHVPDDGPEVQEKLQWLQQINDAQRLSEAALKSLKVVLHLREDQHRKAKEIRQRAKDVLVKVFPEISGQINQYLDALREDNKRLQNLVDNSSLATTAELSGQLKQLLENQDTVRLSQANNGNQEWQRLRDDIRTLERKLDLLEADRNLLKMCKAHYKNLVEARDNSLKHGESELLSLRQSNDEKEAAIRTLEEWKQGEVDRSGDLQKRITEAMEAQKHAEQEITSGLIENDRLKEQLNQKEQDARVHQQTIAELQYRLDRPNDVAAAREPLLAREELHNARSATAIWKGKYTDMESANKQQMLTHVKEIDLFKGKLTASESELTTLQGQYDDLKETADKIEEDLSASRPSATDWQLQWKTLDYINEEAQKGYNEEYDRLNSTIKTLTEQKNLAEGNAAHWIETSTTLVKDMAASITRAEDKLRTQYISDINQIREGHSQQLDTLRDQLRGKEELCDKKSKQHRDAEEKIRNANAEGVERLNTPSRSYVIQTDHDALADQHDEMLLDEVAQHHSSHGEASNSSPRQASPIQQEHEPSIPDLRSDWESICIGKKTYKTKPPSKELKASPLPQWIRALIHKKDWSTSSHRKTSMETNSGRVRQCWLSMYSPEKAWRDTLEASPPVGKYEIEQEKAFWGGIWIDVDTECPECQYRRAHGQQGILCFYFTSEDTIMAST